MKSIFVTIAALLSLLWSSSALALNPELIMSYDSRNALDRYDITLVIVTKKDDCPPCRSMEMGARRLSQEYPLYKLLPLDADDNKKMVSAFDIDTVPSVVLFVKGRPIAGIRGYVSYPQLKRLIQMLERDVLKSAQVQ